MFKKILSNLEKIVFWIAVATLFLVTLIFFGYNESIPLHYKNIIMTYIVLRNFLMVIFLSVIILSVVYLFIRQPKKIIYTFFALLIFFISFFSLQVMARTGFWPGLMPTPDPFSFCKKDSDCVLAKVDKGFHGNGEPWIGENCINKDFSQSEMDKENYGKVIEVLGQDKCECWRMYDVGKTCQW